MIKKEEIKRILSQEIDNAVKADAEVTRTKFYKFEDSLDSMKKDIGVALDEVKESYPDVTFSINTSGDYKGVIVTMKLN